MSPEPAAVVVVAVLEAKPESADEMLAAITAAIEATHNEDGCLNYALHCDLSNPAKFVMVERWKSQEDLDQHGKTPHVAALFGSLAGKLASPPILAFTKPEPIGDPTKGVL